MPTQQIPDAGGVFTSGSIAAIDNNATLEITTEGGQTIHGALTLTGLLSAVAATLTGALIGVAATFSGLLTAAASLVVTGTASVSGTATLNGIKQTLTAIAADGAINVHNAANYIFTKAGAAVMTLGAPTVTVDDGVIITLTGTTADQNTVTATGLFQSGAAEVNVATWPAHAGGTLTLRAYQGKWQILANNLVVIS